MDPITITHAQFQDYTQAAIRPGVLLADRYEVVAKVGEGGMGVVFRAEDRRLSKPVAVKVCRVAGDQAVARFRREAVLQARIQSPHVVPVFDYHTLADGVVLFVMAWIDGLSLAQILARAGGPLPEARVRPWMRQVAEALQAAADEGIIHRDLKPGNVLIDRHDLARVTDFGLAQGPDPAQGLPLTAPGALMGTPHYMAPEQWEDPHGVDTRADVYSFGATFYHALTGRPPFEAPSYFGLGMKHKTEPPEAPTARNRSLSDHLGQVLERCLAKAPPDRFATFADLAQHLQATPAALPPWAGEDAALAPYLERYHGERAAYLTPGRPVEARYAFPHGRALVVRRGDLTLECADVLVSSDNYLLTMSYGVSLALRAAAGAQVAAEARRFAPVRTGRAVVTGPGALKARFLFHAVTIGARAATVILPSRDLIVELINSCFYHADTLQVQSIAFPLLGTGGAGFDPDVCLDIMFQHLARTLARGLTDVREARIILFGG